MSSERYNAPAIGLHWLMAVTIVGLFALGLYMHDLPFSPRKLQFYAWHKWAGVTVLLLALVRLLWRLGHRPPALPAHMGPAERLVAHAGHGVLYVLMFAVPVTGWLMSSAKGFQTVLFGYLPIPDVLQKNQELGERLQGIHWALNMFLAAVVLGHVAAALKHRLIDRDDVFDRILPRRRRAGDLRARAVAKETLA